MPCPKCGSPLEDNSHAGPESGTVDIECTNPNCDWEIHEVMY